MPSDAAPLSLEGLSLIPEDWPYACEEHEGLPAIAVCRSCGRKLCVRCRTLAPSDHSSYCPPCLKENLAENAPPPSPMEQRIEELTSMNPSGSLEPSSVADVPSTIKAVLLKPSGFFASLSREGGTAAALIVGIVCNIVGTLCLLIWAPTFVGSEGTELMLTQVQSGLGWSRDVFLLGLMIALPFFTVLEVLLFALAMHAMLGFLGHRLQPFRVTFKLVAYTLAARLLIILPYVGQLLASVYGVALLIIGTRYAHRAPFLKTAIVVLVPVVVFSKLSLMAMG